MAGTISEFFGYRAEDKSKISLKAATDRKCPFLGTACTKLLGRTREISGVCAIRQKKAGSPSVICCPNRIYAEDYKMLHTVSRMAFATELPLYAGRTAVAKAKSKGGAVAVFGHGWAENCDCRSEMELARISLIGFLHGSMEWASWWTSQRWKCRQLIRQGSTAMRGKH